MGTWGNGNWPSDRIDRSDGRLNGERGLCEFRYAAAPICDDPPPMHAPSSEHLRN